MIYMCWNEAEFVLEKGMERVYKKKNKKKIKLIDSNISKDKRVDLRQYKYRLLRF